MSSNFCIDDFYIEEHSELEVAVFKKLFELLPEEQWGGLLEEAGASQEQFEKFVKNEREVTRFTDFMNHMIENKNEEP